ncbi:MAG TPA: hypothetical protein P5229_05530 [Candidatus Gracilibacteria bacterium]|nr:hypothetical protein [Candidatus Gracilibacteria bacterium]
MLGKSNWFKRRKYSGWGLYPATWQGWVYILVAIGLIVIASILPLEETIRINITFVLTIILILDVIDIMRKLPMDERERIHEALAERNALWVILIALVGGVGWQAYLSAMTKTTQIDPVVIIALVAGVIAKAATNIYLDRKN